MRILFLTPEVPFPPDSGGRLKTSSILDYLRDNHELTLLCFRRRPLDALQDAWASRFPRIRTIPLNRGRDPLTLARSYRHRVPLSIERNRTSAMASVVAEELHRAAFDAVFVDHWLMAQYLPDTFGGRRVLHEHNAEYVIWQRQAARSRNPLVRREAARVRGYESRILARFDHVFAVSDNDREALIALGAKPASVAVLPNIPDPLLLDQPELTFAESGPVILYFGTLSWQPNIDGIERFLAGVFPLVRERLPGARFVLAGRDAPRYLETLVNHAPGIEYIRDADNPEALYRGARVFVEATTTGGGTKLKVLNSLARGLPVVTSPEAAAGLEVTGGEHLLIPEGDDAMADALVSALRDEVLWRRLSIAGRELIRERYIASVAFRVLDEALSALPVSR